MTGKSLRKKNQRIALNMLYVKRNEYISCFNFQSTNEMMKKKNYYLNLNRRKIALSCSKKLSAL